MVFWEAFTETLREEGLDVREWSNSATVRGRYFNVELILTDNDRIKAIVYTANDADDDDFPVPQRYWEFDPADPAVFAQIRDLIR